MLWNYSGTMLSCIPSAADLIIYNCSLCYIWNFFIAVHRLSIMPLSVVMVHCVFDPCLASKVKVKETHYTVCDLLPNAQYEFWVTATNTTGISPASEKAVYMTGKNISLPWHRHNWSVFWAKWLGNRDPSSLLFPAVPSPPVIKPRDCTSCPDAALVRWDSGNTNPVDSYTLELIEMGAESTKSSVTE